MQTRGLSIQANRLHTVSKGLERALDGLLYGTAETGVEIEVRREAAGLVATLGKHIVRRQVAENLADAARGHQFAPAERGFGEAAIAGDGFGLDRQQRERLAQCDVLN